MSKRRKTRNMVIERERSSNGRYTGDCNCLMHHQWVHNEVYEVRHITRSKKFGKGYLDQMKKENILPEKPSLLCTACYKKFKEKYV